MTRLRELLKVTNLRLQKYKLHLQTLRKNIYIYKINKQKTSGMATQKFQGKKNPHDYSELWQMFQVIIQLGVVLHLYEEPV